MAENAMLPAQTVPGTDQTYHIRFPGGQFPRTDSGNSAVLAANFKHLIRWCSPEKRWKSWDGKRWLPDDKELPIACAKETAKILFTQSLADEQRKWAAQSANASKVGAMLKLALPDLAITPGALDTNPFLLTRAIPKSSLLQALHQRPPLQYF